VLDIRPKAQHPLEYISRTENLILPTRLPPTPLFTIRRRSHTLSSLQVLPPSHGRGLTARGSTTHAGLAAHWWMWPGLAAR